MNTTETLEASAVAESTPAEMTGVLADKRFQDSLARVTQLAARERGMGTRVKFLEGEEVAKQVTYNCEHFANSFDERKSIRSQSIRLFAFAHATGAGLDTTGKVDDKEMTKIMRGHFLKSLLPESTQTSLMRLSWDAIKQFLPWLDYNEQTEEYRLLFRVDVGVKDDTGRTTRDIDPTKILNELIPALVASPKGAAAIREIMSKKVESARLAELTFLTDKQRKQASAAKSMADRVKENEERAALFDGFARRIVNAKLSAEQVLDELFRRGLIPATTNDSDGGIDASTIAQLSAIEASTIGKVLNHAKNMDAMAALYNELKPIIDAANVSQANRSASTTVNGTNKPNHDPTSNRRNVNPMPMKDAG